MKYFLMALTLIIAGCGGEINPASNDAAPSMRCIDGVNYIFFRGFSGYSGYGFMSVKFERDGKISLCGSQP